MSINFVVSIVISVVPILSLIFATFLFVHKLYLRIRSQYDATVNCWFCNKYTKVPYLQSNSWTCPYCEQYNGFTKDGDYNKEILEQKNCSNDNRAFVDHFSNFLDTRPSQNGFCYTCNEAQRLKIEKCAQFEPKKESRFDEEFKNYKAELEEQYRLCQSCQRHLNKVLREKKKMVLGSKFLDYIIKGVETFKKPHFQHLKMLTKQKWKSRLATLVTVLTIINISCLATILTVPTRENITNFFGEAFGTFAFMMISHSLAFARVIMSYLENITTHQFVIKVYLYVRTLFLMVLYSFGLRQPQLNRCNFVSLFLLASPFVILATSIVYNLLDRIKLTRFTFLMALWSVFAGGLIENRFPLSYNFLMMCCSCLTCVLSATARQEISPKLQDVSTSSFHKIYSEDYFSDDESITQQLNSSTRSVDQKMNRSSYSPPSFNTPLVSSPITSSTFSLNNGLRGKVSPISSFRSLRRDNPQYDNRRQGNNLCNSTNFIGSTPAFQRYNSPLPMRDHSLSNKNVFNGYTSPMTSFGNTSYKDNHHFLPQNNHHHLDGFNKLTTNASMQSPFSYSTNTLYKQRKIYPISPSRLSTNCLVNNASTSWLSGGYFNQCQHQNKVSEANGFRVEHRSNGVSDDNLSRSSSQSSGFESQNERHNVSRENSCVPDNMDTTLSSMMNHKKSYFKPIELEKPSSNSKQYLNPNVNFTQPPSRSDGRTKSLFNCDNWQTAPSSRRSLLQKDSFNLRKINEELPTIKRGDLLKNWKQNQLRCS